MQNRLHTRQDFLVCRLEHQGLGIFGSFGNVRNPETTINKQKGKGYREMEKRVLLFVVAVAGGMFFAYQASSQILLSGAAYAQNFDSIGEGLPAGWSVWTDASDTSMGTAAVPETNTTSWGDTAGEFRNCASVTNNSGLLATNASSATQHTFTNRVLAVRQGSSFGDPGAAFVLQIANTMGFSNLQFSVDFMMLDDESRETAWTVDYGLGIAPETFTVLGTRTNSGAPGTISRPTYLLGSDADDQPEVVTIRVAALDPSTGTGSRDTSGLDNFLLSFGGAAAVSARLDFEHVGDALVLRWGDPSFSLQTVSGFSGTYTNVSGATSPYTNVMNGAQQFFRLAR